MSGDYRVCIIDPTAWAAREDGLVRLSGLLEDTFDDPEQVLRDELSRCDRLFWVELDEGVPVAFLLASRAPLRVEGQHVPAYYLGLGATHSAHRSQGLMTRFAYAAARDEIVRIAAELRQPLWVWVTTSTPLGFALGAKLGLDWIDPREAGTYSARGLTVARAIREHLGLPGSEADHPFVLRGLDRDIRFSARERARMAEARRRQGATLLDRLDVSVDDGDALLVLFEARSDLM